MDYENENIDKSPSALTYQEIQEDSNSNQFHRLDQEINDIRSKLLKYHKECKSTEMEIYDVNQLKDKGRFVLENIERKYKDLNEELKEIHCNYIKCVTKVSHEENLDRKIHCLTLQRDNLKKELAKLKETADENNKKLIEIKRMITIQEKKNMALLRRLKKRAETKLITPDLKEKINAILRDPRIANTNISIQNIE